MIKFRLRCDKAHEFDAWFGNGDAYAEQQKRGLLSCPHCGSAGVEKALMAPNVSTSRKREQNRNLQPQESSLDAAMPVAAEKRENAAGPIDPRFLQLVRQMREQLQSTAENVGERFAEEARKIHYEEVEPRGIYGKASSEEVGQLLEEGVDFFPLPQLPEDGN